MDKRLQSIVDRIERLEEEKAALAADIREIYTEAKSAGYDVKVLRQVIKTRKLDKAEREEQDALRETYMHALGMLADTPLGRAAVARADDERKKPAPPVSVSFTKEESAALAAAAEHLRDGPPYDPESGEIDEFPPATDAEALAEIGARVTAEAEGRPIDAPVMAAPVDWAAGQQANPLLNIPPELTRRC